MTHPKDILERIEHQMVEELRKQAAEQPRPRKITVKQWKKQ